MDTLFVSAVRILAAVPTSQADCDALKQKTFFGLPVWYKYLTVKLYTPTDTSFVKPFCQVSAGEGLNGYLGIGLAVTEMLLRVVGLAAVGFVIYGGVKYVLSQGEPDNAKNARNTIINALIGVAIALIAGNLVSFIAKRLTS